MKRTLASLALLVPLAAACSSDDAEYVDRPARYSRLSPEFDTLQACLDAKEASGEWFYNCQPNIDLCPGGYAEIVQSDVIHGGTYEIHGDAVTATFTTFSSTDLHFTIQADGSLVQLDNDPRPYQLDTTVTPRCAPLE